MYRTVLLEPLNDELLKDELLKDAVYLMDVFNQIKTNRILKITKCSIG